LQKDPLNILIVGKNTVTRVKARNPVLLETLDAIHRTSPTSRSIRILLDTNLGIEKWISEGQAREGHMLPQRLRKHRHRRTARINQVTMVKPLPSKREVLLQGGPEDRTCGQTDVLPGSRDGLQVIKRNEDRNAIGSQFLVEGRACAGARITGNSGNQRALLPERFDELAELTNVAAGTTVRSVPRVMFPQPKQGRTDVQGFVGFELEAFR